jgi:hypothetical protein
MTARSESSGKAREAAFGRSVVQSGTHPPRAGSVAHIAHWRRAGSSRLKRLFAGRWPASPDVHQPPSATDFDRRIAKVQVRRVVVLNGFTAVGTPITEVTGQALSGEQGILIHKRPAQQTRLRPNAKDGRQTAGEGRLGVYWGGDQRAPAMNMALPLHAQLCERWCPEPESNQRHADFQAVHRSGKSTGCAAFSCQTPYGKSGT